MQVKATHLDLRLRLPSDMTVATPAGRLSLTVPLGGLYNAYNALAASAGALAIGLGFDAIREGIGQLDAAFGRQETLEVDGRHVQILLCKNPTGANQVLRFVGETAQTLLIILNDGIADGRDISWIWDVDYERLAGAVKRVVVSGRRATDMALRLKYAGLEDQLILEPEEGAAIERALAETPPGDCLFVLPTYTAMLSVRDRLAQRAGRPRFWLN